MSQKSGQAMLLLLCVTKQEAITCPDCSSLNIVKNGKTKQRKQRYLCKDCPRQFIRNYTSLGCDPAIRALIVPLTMNGSGVRDISRVLRLSLNTILKTLRQSSTEITDPKVPSRVKNLEIDEFWSFVGAKKQQRWTWYGFDRQRRKVVASIKDRHTDAACKRLLKKLEGCQISRYHTDDWQSDKKFLPAKKHKIGKEETRCIERHNLNFRTHVKRLQRRTICYSKLPEMHDAVLKLYIHHSNNGHHHL